MAVVQAQYTIPSNGSLVVVLAHEAINSAQINLRNTGTNTLLLGPQAWLSPPINLTPTPVVGGGTFASGVFYWKMTSLNAQGESIPCPEVVASIATNGSCQLTWTAVTGATGYKIYRSATQGGESTSPALVTTIGSGSTVTYTDTGAAPSSGAAPSVNTATIPALFPLNASEYLGFNAAPDDTIVAQVRVAGTAGQITVLSIG